MYAIPFLTHVSLRRAASPSLNTKINETDRSHTASKQAEVISKTKANYKPKGA